MPPAKGKGGRPSKKEVELEQQLQEMREVAAEAKRKQVEMEQQLAAVMSQLKKQDPPATPVFSGSPLVQTPPTGSTIGAVVGGSSSGGGAGMATPGDVALAYQHMSYVYEQMSAHDKLAQFAKENIMLKAALGFAQKGNNSEK